MHALSAMIERVAQGIRWVAQGRDARLLQLIASPSSRDTLVELVRVLEHEGDNQRPFMVLGASFATADAWARLREELLREHAAMREAARSVELELPQPTGATNDESEPALHFAGVLAQIAGDLRTAEREEPLVVFVPADAPGLEAVLALSTLVHRLARVRFALVAPEPVLSELVESLGPAAVTLDARLDFAALAAEMASVSATSSSAVAAPDEEPPPAPPDWDDADEATARELPAPRAAVAAKPPGPTIFEHLRALVAGAVALQGAGQLVAAIAKLREARDLCFLHGRDADGIRLEIMLGGFVLAAGDPDGATRVYATAATHAVEHERPILAAQAEMGRGTVLASSARRADAAEAFARAGRFAEDGREPIVALDCYRLSGECALAAGLVPQAAEAWQRGITIVSRSDEPIARTDSVADLADDLARLCEQNGLVEQARSLRERARRLREDRKPDEPSGDAPAPIDARELPPPPIAAPPGPPTAAFPEAPLPFVRAKDRLPAEVKGTVRLDDEPVADTATKREVS